jgi:hypothetical protein
VITPIAAVIVALGVYPQVILDATKDTPIGEHREVSVIR